VIVEEMVVEMVEEIRWLIKENIYKYLDHE